MLNLFLSKYYVSPVPFSFRQGGRDDKWGVWCTLEEVSELLVNPHRLCESLYRNGAFSYFFIPEASGITSFPPFEDICIEDPPCVAEAYIWEIQQEQLPGITLCFSRGEYILGVLNVLQALYRHVVIEGKETAYPDEAQDIAECLLRARAASPDYLFDQIRDMNYQYPLWLPLEPFHAEAAPGSRVALCIGKKGKTLFLPDIEPDPFRHDLEHLVFHDETSLRLSEHPFYHEESGLYFEGEEWEVVLKRVRQIPELSEEPILFLSLLSPNHSIGALAGFCREKDVLTALCGVFRERYPKSTIGRPLRRYLGFLR